MGTALRFSRKQLGIPYAVFCALFVVFPLVLIVIYAFTDAAGHFNNASMKIIGRIAGENAAKKASGVK